MLLPVLVQTLDFLGSSLSLSHRSGTFEGMEDKKRRENEKKFARWESLSDGGRRYFYDVAGRKGWLARYVKEVDKEENTIRFYQEIYNEDGHLVERHQKYPTDTGHQKIKDMQ